MEPEQQEEADMIFEPKGRYLSLHGSYIDQLGDESHELVTPDMMQLRLDRDKGGHHVTVVNHLDMVCLMPPVPTCTKKELKKHNRSALQQIHLSLTDEFGDASTWEKPIDLGVGSCQEGQAITYFKVIHWPLGQKMRGFLGLAPSHFHVTMGFTPRDVHLYKGPATLVCLQAGQPCTTQQLHAIVKYASYYYLEVGFIKKLMKACFQLGLYGQAGRFATVYIRCKNSQRRDIECLMY